MKINTQTVPIPRFQVNGGCIHLEKETKYIDLMTDNSVKMGEYCQMYSKDL